MKDPSLHQALFLLGCPELPVQTSLAIYLADLITNLGGHVVIAGNKASLNLIRTADPKGHYVRDTADLDAVIGDLAQKTMDADICYVFIHNDAGISYLATASALISGEATGMIFGPEAQSLAHQCSDLDLKHIWAKAVHNPGPMISKIKDEVERWAASTR